MAPRPLLLLLLLLLLPLAGPAAPAPERGQLPRLRGAPTPGRARRPPPRAPRHSDGTLTSELSRLRDRARLQRLLQGLLGKRSQQDSKPGPASWSRPCAKWSHCPPAGLEALRATPGPRLVNPAASWARGWGLGFGAGQRRD